MLALGQALYGLTEKDGNSLLLDPWLYAQSFTIAAAASAGTLVTQDIPRDRCLWLDHMDIFFGPALLNNWSTTNLFWTNRSPGNPITLPIWGNSVGTSIQILFDAQAQQTTENAGNIQRELKRLLPPGGRIEYTFARNGTTNPVLILLQLFGYLIPAGNVGRLS